MFYSTIPRSSKISKIKDIDKYHGTNIILERLKQENLYKLEYATR